MLSIEVKSEVEVDGVSAPRCLGALALPKADLIHHPSLKQTHNTTITALIRRQSKHGERVRMDRPR